MSQQREQKIFLAFFLLFILCEALPIKALAQTVKTIQPIPCDYYGTEKEGGPLSLGNIAPSMIQTEFLSGNASLLKLAVMDF